MRRDSWISFVGALLVACGGGSSQTTGSGDGGGQGGDGGTGEAGSGLDGSTDGRAPDGSMSDGPASDAKGKDGGTQEGSTPGCSATSCPTGYTCGTANGKSVCRAPSGIPMFSNIFLILMENTSLTTLDAAITAGAAPNLDGFGKTYASGSAYHGVSHPSLPNYIALTSGSTQGIGCDCEAQTGQGSCNIAVCNIALGDCSCDQSVPNLADQIETAKETWLAFGEGMSTPCNTMDDSTTQYAVRHVPFLYYDDIQSNIARCGSHVVDFSSFNPATAPQFTFIAPNLTDDMHDPTPATQANITNGDSWIGPQVTKIMASSSYTNGGLIVVVWDEDDDSGLGSSGSDAPIPIYLISPYAKSAGYLSSVEADHYSLLATIEDAMNLPRLGMAGMSRPMMADTLADFFPSK
jgi:hypothetical protein